MDKTMTQERSAPGKSVILVIDDDLAMRNSLKFALEVEGFSVQVYPTGTALLRGWDRGTARATLGEGLAVSAFPLYVPV
jgi:CheY-like chemotaxis protein